ncbi:MAG: protein kinase domain-containing protein [Pyrinomonadaceae bacterium]
MAICQECGSQTADNDIFCPYCGITLQPPAGESASAPDESFDSTIMMPAMGKDAQTERPEPSDDSFEHIPIPAILTDHVKTVDNLTQSTSELEFSETNSEVEDRHDPDETAAAIETSEQRQDDRNVVVQPDTPDLVEDTNTGGDLSRDRPADKEQRIGRPSVELDAAAAHDPTFDSVRIIEPKSISGEDDVDTRIQGYPAFGSMDLPTPAAAQEVAPARDTEPAQANESTGRTDTDGRKGTKLKPLGEGTVLNGRYEIVRRVGGGGMGAVYLASDNNLGGVLRAVKEMVQAHIEEEQQEKSISDFKRESMILSTLDHPSIPTIYDYFYDDDEGRFYLVMKYISGGDLSSRLRAAPAGKIEELSVTEWALQIIDVLDYLHNQPSTIVYRDLKPSNIMLDGNTGRIMLIDFGIARSISQKEEKGVTAVGTMGYAPPELFSGNVEPRSDIYSLGSTMFHLLTGADPQSNPLLIFDFQKNPRPRQINPQLSDQMERILMRAVEYNAEARFASAAEMKCVLEDHLANLLAGKVSYGIKEVPAAVSLANQAVFCGFCGQRIVATDLFCAFCGSKQPIAQQGVHSEIYSKAVSTAKLVIEGTSELVTPAFTLQKDENLLGRRDPMSNIFPEVDLSKFDPQTKISRRHARIWREAGKFMVEDLGSSNGTILESQQKDAFRLPPRQPHMLSSGDKLKLGDTILHFTVG